MRKTKVPPFFARSLTRRAASRGAVIDATGVNRALLLNEILIRQVSPSVTPTMTQGGHTMIYTIGQTAKAVGLSKTTICKHIESGKLSARWNEDTNPRQREIDTSEILRVYGVDVTVPPSQRQQVTPQNTIANTPLDMVVKAKDETIAALKADIDRLAAQIAAKDEQIAAANRLLAAPKADPYAPVLERLAQIEREMAARLEAESPPPSEKTAPAPPPNRGMFGWLRGRAA